MRPCLGTEGIYKYTEKATADSRQEVVWGLGLIMRNVTQEDGLGRIL
jgi:hypothetical protein